MHHSGCCRRRVVSTTIRIICETASHRARYAPCFGAMLQCVAGSASERPGREPATGPASPPTQAQGRVQLHASCVARGGAGILLLGPPGSGKSDLTLRLIDRGFSLVADDRVDMEAGIACAPAALAGLLEVRGLGILRLPFTSRARIHLVISLGGRAAPRLPAPLRHPTLNLPLLHLDQPSAASAALRVATALDCALGHVTQLAGAFAP